MKKYGRGKLVAVALLAAAVLSGCGAAAGKAETVPAGSAAAESAESSTAAEAERSGEAAAEAGKSPSAGAGAMEDPSRESAPAETGEEAQALRIGSLKGPTSMGLVSLMEESEAGSAEGSYLFSMEVQPDVLLGRLVSGELDIALLPANLAAVAYQKTKQQLTVLDINTLGVLYCVSGDESIQSIRDLSGRTVLSTGQGASPEHVLNYLLGKNGITDCTVEFKSEAAEIAAALTADPMQAAILPQPFATAVSMQNEKLKTAFSLTEEWEAVSKDSALLTGVTVVRREALEKRPAAVELFLSEHRRSTERVNGDVKDAASLVVKYGILEKAPVAEKAIPACNLVCISGEEMKTMLSGYLQVLYEADPRSVGGQLPGDDFYG